MPRGPWGPALEGGAGGAPRAEADPPPLAVWASDHFEVPLPPTHTFPMAKYRAVREALLADGTIAAGHVRRSEPAPLEWLATVHDEDYIERMLDGRIEAAEERRLGFPWSAELVLRARGALYGTVMAARAALEDDVAGNLAGGTHHAFRARGEGYCLFNDHAVAIAVLRTEGLVHRPFVCDLDVHQGNGTAAVFAGDDSVFTFSLHGAGNYPAQKERGSFDLELPDGTRDEEYLAALDAHLPRTLELHEPDLLLYQAGVDALACDRFGRLSMTHAGLAARDERVFRLCEERAIPVVVTLGGGYGRPLEETVEAHANVFRAARRWRGRRLRSAAPHA